MKPLSLFDPNTLLPHRAGIAGLALALSALDPNDAPIKWNVSEDAVSLRWERSDKEALEWLMQETYTIQYGLLVAPALNLARRNCYPFSKGVLDIFLQFSSGNKQFEEREENLTFTIEDTEVSVKNRPLLWCYYTDTSKLTAFTEKGHFKPKIQLTSKHLPGLVQDFANSKHYSESPEGFVALLFLPIACSYFQLPFVPHPDPKRKTKVPTYAVVIPEVTNLIAWTERRKQLCGRINRNFRSLGAGESGLRVLLQEKLLEDFESHRVKYCEVYRIGPQQWDKQQIGLKQDVYRISIDDETLELYQIAAQHFRPQKRKKQDGESWLALSKVLPWIAENLVTGRAWYAEFYEFRKANDIYERKGLVAMTEHLTSNEQCFFDAVQGAFSVYLQRQIEEIIDKQKRQFNNDEYRRVTDKVIYRLQRPSTQQEFATALVDFLSQFRSKAARGVGTRIYAWIHGAEWRKARDLTMLAIATYQGKGNGAPDATDADAIASLPEPEAETESEEYTESLL